MNGPNSRGLGSVCYRVWSLARALCLTGEENRRLINLLNDVPRGNGSEWVFPNSTTNKPFVNFFCAWDNARKKAGLSDVRVHDLRHSFASFLVNSGRTLFEVQRILGHTQVKTTQRYAHLSHDTLLDASNAAARAVGNIFLPTLSSPKSVGLLPMAQ